MVTTAEIPKTRGFLAHLDADNKPACANKVTRCGFLSDSTCLLCGKLKKRESGSRIPDGNCPVWGRPDLLTKVIYEHQIDKNN
ncbi:MAG: hypothetical protein PHG36_05450 [Dehalococcoidia bacterium]|nr:hypothetical protein [Dehalococcoidia bacterium]